MAINSPYEELSLDSIVNDLDIESSPILQVFWLWL